MPARKRRSKRPTMTLESLNAAMSRGSWEGHWGGPEEGRAAYQALRHELDRRPGERSGPFWWYEPRVPEELRDDVELSVTWIGPGDEEWREKDRREAEQRRELEQRRAAWLRATFPEEFTDRE